MHGRAVRAERERANGAGEEADFTRLVEQWGGVTIAYRKGLTDSPAYRLNHEEVAKCLEEGIVIAEGLSPLEAVPDQHGAVKAVRFALQTQVDGHDETEPLLRVFPVARLGPLGYDRAITVVVEADRSQRLPLDAPEQHPPSVGLQANEARLLRRRWQTALR